ncbi:MAG: DUF4870 domain-containing protein [Bacteroidota bacterium]
MSVTTTSDEARSWGMLAHLSALLGLLSGIGFFVGPLIVYLVKRDSHPFVEENAREALNFQITALIALAVATVLAITIIGLIVAIPAFVVIGLAMVILPIVAGLRARDGETYRYPFTLRLI